MHNNLPMGTLLGNPEIKVSDSLDKNRVLRSINLRFCMLSALSSRNPLLKRLQTKNCPWSGQKIRQIRVWAIKRVVRLRLNGQRRKLRKKSSKSQYTTSYTNVNSLNLKKQVKMSKIKMRLKLINKKLKPKMKLTSTLVASW